MPHIAPALGHLEAENNQSESFTICLWDTASTGVRIPPFPWDERSMSDKECQNGSKIINPLIHFKDEVIRGAYELGTKILSMLNKGIGIAVYWVPDARQIPYYEAGAPLRAIFRWWARDNGLQLVHAGAVGNSEGGVLLTGKTGSGKSCTAISCLNSGLSYAGDDYVLISTEQDAYSYSLYNSCKLSVPSLHRFPNLSSLVTKSEVRKTEKIIMFLKDLYPERVAKGFRIRAILLPKVGSATKTGLKEVSPATALAALAPSTVFQLGGAKQVDLTKMASLVRQVPCYLLELGKNTNRISEIILPLVQDDYV